MTKPVIAPAFCQVDWVVRDLAAADGTYLGKPGNWVCNLHIVYAGDTQIELIQPVSGASMYQESLDRHGDAVQHVAYWLDDADYDAASEREGGEKERGIPRPSCEGVKAQRDR